MSLNSLTARFETSTTAHEPDSSLCSSSLVRPLDCLEGTATESREPDLAAVVRDSNYDEQTALAVEEEFACSDPEQSAGLDATLFCRDAPKIRVGEKNYVPPGSRASTVEVAPIWNSMMRWLLGSSCGALRTFCFSFFSSQANRKNKSYTPGPVWPIPLPFSPRHLADREHGAFRRALNAMVIVLSWLHLGQPTHVPSDFCAASHLTGEQKAVVNRLSKLSADWIGAQPVAAADMGRTAGKVETLEDMMKALTKEAEMLLQQEGSGLGASGKIKTTSNIPAASASDGLAQARSKKKPPVFQEVQVAKEIEASRLNFGGRPAFRPLEFFDKPTADLYAAPLDNSIRPEDCLERPPRVQVRGSRQEILKLLHALDRSGRLALFKPEEIRMPFRSGLFALIKNQEVDRMIMDSRPHNLLERPLTSWTRTMAAVPPILDLMMSPGEKVITACEDLRDYYYYFVVSRQRAARNALRFELSHREASAFKAYREVENPTSCAFLVPSLNTMAMGDVNAVEYGQQSHVQIALRCGILPTDLLTMKGVFPRQSWAVGVIIDDLVVIEKVPRSLNAGDISTTVADLMVEAYHDVGLCPHDKKRVRDAVHAKFWGISLDGESGILRAQVERVLPMTALTAKIAKLGYASRKLLEVVVGSWIAILQCRRRCMCLLSAVFEDIQSHEYDSTFRLQEQVVAELWTLVVLAPLFCSDLRALPNQELSLVDASGDFRAEVVCKLPPVFAAELWRHKLTKAAWTKLLSPVRALSRMHGLLDPTLEVPAGELPANAHPHWTVLARTLQFNTKQIKAVNGSVHINLSELKAALEAEARKSRSSPNSRFLVGADSQVSLGSLIKGRSSSRGLNSLLRRFLPTILGCNVYTGWQYIASADNVSDDPTRRRDCRVPPQQVPEWLEQAFGGEFKAMDDFLSKHGVDESSLAQLPEMQVERAIPAKDDSVRSQRRRAWQKQRSLRTGLGQNSVNPPVVATRFRAAPWMPSDVLTGTAQQLLRAVPREQFVFPAGCDEDALLKLPGHLDLFSGSRRAAIALARQTKRWVLCYDILHSANEDLLDPRVQNELDTMLRAGCFLSLTGGPVCSSFSRAVCPPVRSRLHPAGLAHISGNMRIKVEVGNRMADWLAAFCRACLLLHLVVWIENPAGSFLWLMPSWVKLISDFSLRSFYTDYCRWKTPWRKRTRFYGNFAAAGLSLLCNCQSRHVQLRGYSRRHGVSWTKAAEAYPHSLCRFLARAVYESLKPIERRRVLDPAACARCGSSRIGEAQNPGPRMPRPRPSADNLEDINLVQPTTMLLQKRVHEKFVAWIASELGSEALRSLQRAPKLQLHFCRTFGQWLYTKGEAMYIYRHLLVYLQQMFPSERPALAGAWSLLQRWELIQPVAHRPPLPRIILDALLALSLSWGWHRWAALTSLAFFGVLRVGEPLRATRADLLLPEDCGVDREVLFLQINFPKSGRRGKGRVQHSKVTHLQTIQLVRSAFGSLAPDDPLYPTTASTYRRRWDKLIDALGIDRKCNLTPGCLRPGGAVFLYHCETPIYDLLWRMRLKHLATLESYLQETAALNVVQKINPVARHRVKSCAAMLPFILRQFSSWAVHFVRQLLLAPRSAAEGFRWQRLVDGNLWPSAFCLTTCWKSWPRSVGCLAQCGACCHLLMLEKEWKLLHSRVLNHVLWWFGMMAAVSWALSRPALGLVDGNLWPSAFCLTTCWKSWPRSVGCLAQCGACCHLLMLEKEWKLLHSRVLNHVYVGRQVPRNQGAPRAPQGRRTAQSAPPRKRTGAFLGPGVLKWIDMNW